MIDSFRAHENQSEERKWTVSNPWDRLIICWISVSRRNTARCRLSYFDLVSNSIELRMIMQRKSIKETYTFQYQTLSISTTLHIFILSVCRYCRVSHTTFIHSVFKKYVLRHVLDRKNQIAHIVIYDTWWWKTSEMISSTTVTVHSVTKAISLSLWYPCSKLFYGINSFTISVQIAPQGICNFNTYSIFSNIWWRTQMYIRAPAQGNLWRKRQRIPLVQDCLTSIWQYPRITSAILRTSTWTYDKNMIVNQKDDLLEIDVNMMIWWMFMSATMKAAVHLRQKYQKKIRTKNTDWKKIKE